ncbi:MAG: MFS transporter [Candidatus Handelsmanbacteria bacterium RIFCSPLOWO2_12_FULL_64_10]|uniref:MFS transporter n=1 Tax=Handelsmanbacteria sp. (strain RIFCSPLOWO2_12_FULL_64_10) TaxID=1817868 RepID=A0A1F6CIF3_HANXR|nr:MAG: MFS transporter [Candidatus Handelsmanbacteria bacterium RIFCSPLOWO2_12_FULL_64_10]
MITVDHLAKNYGPFVAVNDISFEVAKGEILGFLGPNGAGKTTTMRILTGYMPPTSGRAVVAGYDIFKESLEARRHIAYLPETVPLYTDMSPRDYLDFVGKIRGMSRSARRSRIDDVAEMCRITEFVDRLIGKLSKGQRQRVGLAQALMPNPDVLVLDEPTIGLDPRQIVETRQVIKNLRGEHTVILSTHILPEVSVTCERVVIINRGKIVAVDTPENLQRRMAGSDTIELDIRGPEEAVQAALRALPQVIGVRSRANNVDSLLFSVECEAGADLRETLASTVVQRGWGLRALRPAAVSLEDVFVQLVTDEAPAA